MCVSLVCQGCLKVVPKVLCLKGVRRMLQKYLSGCWVFQEGFKDVSWLFQNYFNCFFSVFQGNDKLELSSAKLSFIQLPAGQRYIPQLFSQGGGGNKPEHLGKNGEENWYIRTFFHIFTQRWVNSIYLRKLQPKNVIKSSYMGGLGQKL